MSVCACERVCERVSAACYAGCEECSWGHVPTHPPTPTRTHGTHAYACRVNVDVTPLQKLHQELTEEGAKLQVLGPSCDPLQS
jgi:hypothetical protein